jgi:flagellar biosynthesis GTPase FlhF
MPPLSTGHIFISYSRRDSEAMLRIVSYLREQGINAWVDNEKLVPGTPIWEYEIEKAIRGAFAIVVVLSPDAKKSEWVLREITLADQFHKRVFPVLVGGSDEDSIPLRLITRQFADLRKDEPTGLKSLITEISFYSEELTRLEEERVAVEIEAARLKKESEAAEKAARDAQKKAEAEKKARDEAERVALQKAEARRLVNERAREAERLEKEKAERYAAHKAEEERREKEKAEIENKDRSHTEDDQILHELIEVESSTTKNVFPFEAQAKDLLTAIDQFLSIGKRKYIGISAVVVIAFAGIGLNIFKNQTALMEEQLTHTQTSAPIDTPTSTLTKTLTATPTRRPTSTPTRTVTPSPTANLAATRRVIDSAATEESADNLLSQASRWSIKLSDTFSNNNNNWHTTTIDSEWGKGSIRVTDGKYRWTYSSAKGSIYRAWKYTVSLSDFYLAVDGQETGASITGELGVVFRNSEAGDFYYFGIHPGSQSYFFYLNYDDEWSPLINYTKFPSIYSDRPNKLSIIARGSQFSFFINDQFATEATDDTLSYGPIGLAIALNNANESSAFEFDNFELRTP